jgi:hypothetical protein
VLEVQSRGIVSEAHLSALLLALRGRSSKGPEGAPCRKVLAVSLSHLAAAFVDWGGHRLGLTRFSSPFPLPPHSKEVEATVLGSIRKGEAEEAPFLFDPHRSVSTKWAFLSKSFLLSVPSFSFLLRLTSPRSFPPLFYHHRARDQSSLGRHPSALACWRCRAKEHHGRSGSSREVNSAETDGPPKHPQRLGEPSPPLEERTHHLHG